LVYGHATKPFKDEIAYITLRAPVPRDGVAVVSNLAHRDTVAFASSGRRVRGARNIRMRTTVRCSITDIRTRVPTHTTVVVVSSRAILGTTIAGATIAVGVRGASQSRCSRIVRAATRYGKNE